MKIRQILLVLHLKRVDAHALTSMIGNEVFFSISAACHANSFVISPVLKAVKIDIETATCTVRISTGKYTTDEEIDLAIKAICDKVTKILTT